MHVSLLLLFRCNDDSVIIILGIVIGLVYRLGYDQTGDLNLSIEAFFFYILPP